MNLELLERTSGRKTKSGTCNDKLPSISSRDPSLVKLMAESGERKTSLKNFFNYSRVEGLFNEQ